MVGLSSLDPYFTFSEWDRMLPYAELTLNLLRAARSNPKRSAWAYLFGKFNYGNAGGTSRDQSVIS